MSISLSARTRQAVALSGLTLASLSVHAQGTGEPSFYWHHGWDWGHTIFGGLMMLLFWGGIILLVVLGVRWLGRGPESGAGPGSRQTALEILEERFARGEIDKEEFEERKRALSR